MKKKKTTSFGLLTCVLCSQEQFHKHILGPASALYSFCTVHDPKVIARVLRECFEDRYPLWQHNLDLPFSSAESESAMNMSVS